MDNRPLRILQVNTRDTGGGAARVARNLLEAYRERRYESWLAVGFAHGRDPHTLVFPTNTSSRGLHWSGAWLKVATRLQSVRGLRKLSGLARALAKPRSWLDVHRGIEDFHFPGTWRLLALPPHPPDIIHCHNLHGGYFDLRALAWLSHQVPLVLTLHDAWLLAGHCAHSFECERWKLGCGHCPDLTIYPAIRRDATAYNFRRKREIFAHSRIYLSTPSRWLMKKTTQSILAPAIANARVIPNGVDLSIFHPANRRISRAAVGIPENARVLLFVADGITRNVWKDYQTLRVAISRVADRTRRDQEVLLIALGENGPAERIGRAQIRFVPYQRDPVCVANFYRAADVYLHAARVDTFPSAVVEALACGTPVVATAVGGVAEQVRSMYSDPEGTVNNAHDHPEATGVLVKPGDAESMAKHVVDLLTNESLRARLARNASQDARDRFDLERQADVYLDWYELILCDFQNAGRTQALETVG